MTRHTKAAAATAVFYALCALPALAPPDIAKGAWSTMLVIFVLLSGGQLYRSLLDD